MTVATWKVVSDGSVNGPGNPSEIVSPPLNGKAGIDQTIIVCRVLKETGCIVNRSCGLHVHVDARQLQIAALRKLAVNYIDFEGVIDGLLPATRRGDTNVYLRTLTRSNKVAIANARDLRNLAATVGNARYVKLNFTAFWRHGTVEFRHHSGTVEGVKAANWIKFCLRMVDKAASDPVIEVESRPGVARPILTSEASRRATFVRLLLRPEGATRDEIFMATGWRKGSLSMKRFAAEAGLVLRSTRGRPKRYYATLRGAEMVAVAARTNEISLSGLTSMLEMEADEVAYWNQRQAAFRGQQQEVAA